MKQINKISDEAFEDAVKNWLTYDVRERNAEIKLVSTALGKVFVMDDLELNEGAFMSVDEACVWFEGEYGVSFDGEVVWDDN